MTNNCFVTIGVPIYNVSKFIERCAVSLFEQTYENIEYIFVNDQTPDDSMNILMDVIERYPRRKEQIRIIEHHKNRGLSAARNSIILAAKGEFLIWVDSDDWIDSNTVDLCVKSQQATNADIVNFGTVQHFTKYNSNMDNPNYISAHEMCLSMIYSGLHHVWGRLIRTALYHDNNILVEEGLFQTGEDYVQTTRLAFYAKIVKTIPQSLYHYNCVNDSSYTSNLSDKHAALLRRAYDIVGDFFKPLGGDYLDAINKSEAVMVVREILRVQHVSRENCLLLNKYKAFCHWLPLRQKILFFIPTVTLKNLYIRCYFLVKNKLLGNIK